MNFLKIDINNFDTVYVRHESIVAIWKQKVTSNITEETYRVIVELDNGGCVKAFEHATSDVADKFIEDLFQNINIPPIGIDRFDIPYTPDNWKGLCQGDSINDCDDEEWKSC